MWDISDKEEDVDHILDEFSSPSDSRIISFEMTDFNNLAFDRDDVPAEVVDHIIGFENDDSNDDDTDADDTLEEYNGEQNVNLEYNDNNTIIESDVIESDDKEE